MPFVSQSAMKTYWVVDYLKLKCSCIDSRNPALKSTSARAHVINLCWILSYYGMKLPLCIELCTIPQRQESLCNSGRTPPEGDKLEAFCSLLRVETASIKWNKCAMTHIILLEGFPVSCCSWPHVQADLRLSTVFLFPRSKTLCALWTLCCAGGVPGAEGSNLISHCWY